MLRTALLATLLVAPLACAGPGQIHAVEDLDVQRYLGTWYDVASFPQSFQEGCHCTTAQYSLQSNGEIGVLNSCRKGEVDGPIEQARARAFVPDPERPAELKVEFFWPFAADYWVIELGEAEPGPYTHAVVSEPSQQYLWILSRTPEMNRTTYDAILQRLADQEFDLERLQQTPQAGCPAE